jgi:uncharacterized protein (TIGR00290 family)
MLLAASTADDPATPVVFLWSGGKDAALGLDALAGDDRYGVAALVVTVVEGAETVTMHGTPLPLIRAQAAALGVPLTVMHVPPEATNATYQSRLERALAPHRAEGIDTVAVADIFLEDIRAYREDVFATLGVEGVFPIWGEDTGALARRFWDRGFEAVVASVDTTQVDASLAGRPYDEAFVDALPDGADPCGENGEFHTFVTASPLFDTDVPVEVTKRHGDGRMRYARLEKA